MHKSMFWGPRQKWEFLDLRKAISGKGLDKPPFNSKRPSPFSVFLLSVVLRGFVAFVVVPCFCSL